MKRCPKCKKQYDDSWKVCLACSVPLDEITYVQTKQEHYQEKIDALLASADSPKICPKCKKQYDQDWKICINCNVELLDVPQGGNIKKLQEELTEVENTIKVLEERAGSLKNMIAQIKEKGDSLDVQEQIAKYKEEIKRAEAEKGILKEENVKKIVSEAHKQKKEKKNFEEVLAKFIFGVLGVALFGLGVSYFTAAYFIQLPLFAKICVGYFASLVMIISGHLLRKNEKFITFGKILTGGGWALVYALTYLIHHVPAARLISDPLIGTAALLVVSVAIIIYYQTYKSEMATSIAYFAAFVALVASPLTVYTIAASVLLAASLLFFIFKHKWFRFGMYGVSMLYLSNFLCLSRFSEMISTAPQFFIAQGLVCLYWIMFTSAAFILRKKNSVVNIDEGFSLGAGEMLHAINGIGAIFLSLYMTAGGFKAYYPNVIGAISCLYLVVTALAYILKQRSACILVSNFLIMFSAAFFTIKYPSYALASYIIIAQLVFLAGVKLKQPYWRVFGFASFILILSKLLLVDHIFIKNALALDNVFLRFFLPGFIFLIYPLNSIAYLRLEKNQSLAKEEKSIPTVILYSYAAIYACGTWLDLPKVLTAPAWILLGVILLHLGVSKNNYHLRIQGSILSIGAFVRLLMSNMTIPGHVMGISYRLLTVVPVIFILQYCNMLFQDEKTQSILKEKEKNLPYIFPSIIFIALMVLTRYELPRLYVAPAWGIFALIYAAISIYFNKTFYYSFASIAAIFASGRAVYVNLIPGKYLAGAESTILIAVILAGILYGGNALYIFSREKILKLNETQSAKVKRFLQSPNIVFSISATFLVSAIIFVKFSGLVLTFCWAVQAILLLLCGFIIKERYWRYLGLVLLFVSAFKVLFYDYVEMGGHIFYSFIFLGLILIAVSGVYFLLGDKLTSKIKKVL